MGTNGVVCDKATDVERYGDGCVFASNAIYAKVSKVCGTNRCGVSENIDLNTYTNDLCSMFVVHALYNVHSIICL